MPRRKKLFGICSNQLRSHHPTSPQGGGKRRFYSPYSMHLPWRESWLIDVASF